MNRGADQFPVPVGHDIELVHTAYQSDPVRDESIETVGGYWVIQLLAREVHELSDEVKSSLSQKEFIEWLTEIENNSTITIHLDEEMKSFAVKKVTKRRT